jgi:hypothetical protein
MGVLIAPPLALFLSGLVAHTGGSVTRPQEPRVALGVHVQQIARARPLIAAGRIPRRPHSSRKAVPAKHLPHRGMRIADLARDQPRPPPSPPPGRADPRLGCTRKQGGTAMRPTRPVSQTGERASLGLARLPPPPPPPMRRRDRHARPCSRLPQRRAPLHRLHQRPTSSRSELRVTVHIHPSLPGCRRGRHSQQGGSDGTPSTVHNVHRRDT